MEKLHSEELRDLFIQEKLISDQIKRDEVGRAWGKQDKYLVFGRNAGVERDSSCVQEHDEVHTPYKGQSSNIFCHTS
jgi:hypothetical protein